MFNTSRITMLCVGCIGALGPSVVAGSPPMYESDVRPILKAHCFHCHGEAGEKEGGLDLRLRRLMVAGGDSGPAIQPGQPEASLLLQRIQSGEMPPAEDKRLPAANVATITAWIAAGAKTENPEPAEIGDGPLFTDAERSYWAFQPVVRPNVPPVIAADQVETPIDAFLLAELQTQSDRHKDWEAMPRFQPRADRERLLRRAWLGLLGLPPAPETVAEFVADESPDAWVRLIDELLASPHYGERWGRHWLDVVGYADSEGYNEEDRVRPDAYRYRDYVVRAWNANKPFDVFIREQLAGDEMVPPPYRNLSPEQIERITATGFLRMAPDGTASGGIDQALARNQVIADTLQIVASSLLGISLHCAQCHDHRYDPVPQADYYRLRAVFEPALDWKNWKSPPARRISLYTDADRALAQQIESEAAEVDRQRQQKTEAYITRTLEEELLMVDESLRDALRTAYRTAAKDRTSEQQALLKEYPSVANISPGSLYLYDRRREERARKIDAARIEKERRFVAESRQRALAAVPESERAAVEAAAGIPVENRSAEQRSLLMKYPGTEVTIATLDRFAPEAAAEIERDRQTAAQLRADKAADDLKAYSDRAAEIRGRKPQEGFLRAISEVPGGVPATFVFHRGDHEQPRQQVEPGGLSILSDDHTIPVNDEEIPTSGRRLAWAMQLTSGRHPLVARVIVNRIWMHHFGRGLVGTPSDFGSLGDRPTHPRLLDWLAAEFVDSGWSVKHIHRIIMQSAAYQQSSRASAAVVAADPDNRLYTRFPVQRLESEIVRDAMLSISGQLNRRLYGEPVPVMEDEVGQIVIGKENLDGERKPTDTISLNGQEFRRSLYVQVRRSRTLSVLEAFDAPEMSPNCERRDHSTAATQSLLLMNSAFAVDTARQFAHELLAAVGDDQREQVRRAWLTAYGSAPTEPEIAAALEFLSEQHAAVDGQGDESAGASDRTLQTLATFCQALISSNRFLYID